MNGSATGAAELAEAGVGSAPEEGDGLPAVAGGDRAVGTESVPEHAELPGERWWIEAPRQAVALANAEVVDRPDVEAAQLEHQIHLGRPAADAAHRHETGDDVVVTRLRRRAQVDGAVQDLCRQVPE